jgi:deazaflavin-dependent oxidoreductase (nitroreductase family)
VRWQKLYNPIVVSLLRSPLHGVMSKSVMLLTYKGRRSAREFTTPVSYVRDGGELLVVSSRDHSWWKNLRGGAPVAVRVRGLKLEGIAEAFEGENAGDGLLAVLRAVPAYRRYWGIELDSNR